MKVVELREVCDLLNGYAFKSSDYIDESDTLNCRMSNIRPDGTFNILYNPKYLPNDYVEKYSKFKLKDGDLVIAMTDMANDPKILGVPTIVKTKGKTLLLNQRVGKLIIDESKIWVPYLQYSLNRTSVKKYYTKFAGGGLQLNVGKKEILGVKIPLPPLPQQKQIAKILDTADTYRQKTKALIAKYDELTQSLFLDMFGDPVSNPMGWEKVEMQSFSKISSGSTPSRKVDEYYKGDIPWVKTGEVNGVLILDTKEKISKEALANSSCKLYPKGSLIIAMYGQGKTRGQVGMLGIDATTNQACAVLSPSDKVNYFFLWEILKLSYSDLRELGRGGNQPNLNAGLIKSYKVINPNLSLQNQFAERVKVIEQQKALAQASLQKADDLFNVLLQRAFKGELVK